MNVFINLQEYTEVLNLYLTRYKYQISCELIDYNIFFDSYFKYDIQ